MAKWFLIAGAILMVIGAMLHFFPGILSWFGRLPGDLRIQGEKSRVFIPITSMIIISILLTIILNLFKR
ncbi:MAG: DUF2905 domain-containing protein [Pseudomonadales bacterium]|nr:DUF2905 domain-containing protein [Pseudomonadales bacterium]